MKAAYPIRYRAALLPAYQPNPLRALLSIENAEKSIVALHAGQLLIRMEAAPCNPSDIAFMQGGYNVVKPLPAVPGFEGAGIVADVGKEVDKQWVGKRVAVFIQGYGDGSWAEYVVVSPKQVLAVNDALSAEQAATFFVNPFTAYGLMEAALAHNCKSLIINAAGSRLSEYFMALAKEHNMQLIALARKEQTAETLKNKGVAKAIVTSASDFGQQLKAAIDHYRPTVFLDAVAGEQCGMVANLLPPDSLIVVYGGLSGKEISGINPLQLIFKKLKLSGFDLNAWFANAGEKKIEEVAKHLTQLILEKKVQNPVALSVGLDELAKGLRQYLGAMSEGKMLIRF